MIKPGKFKAKIYDEKFILKTKNNLKTRARSSETGVLTSKTYNGITSNKHYT